MNDNIDIKDQDNSIRIITSKISLPELKKIAEERFGDLVKAVVDVDRRIMAIGGELHADEEAQLLEDGSRQEHLWGINLYPDKTIPDMIEFDSMINIRPSQGNRSRAITDEHIRSAIVAIVKGLVAE